MRKTEALRELKTFALSAGFILLILALRVVYLKRKGQKKQVGWADGFIAPRD